MLYQVQKYQTDDFTKRSVVAQSENIESDEQSKSWYSGVVFEQTAEDGRAFALIPQNHDWYVPQVEEPKAPAIEGGPVRFEDVAKVELELSAKRRLEQYQAEQKFQANLAKLSQ